MEIFDAFNKKLLYYRASKCASTTIGGWLIMLENPEIIPQVDRLYETRIYTDKSLKRQKRVTDDYISHDAVKFCVVRDPVERFVSGYTSLILKRRLLEKQYSLEEFLDIYDKKCDSTATWIHIKMHLMSQTEYYGKSPEIFSYIFNMDEIGKVKSLLERYSNISLPDIHLAKGVESLKPIVSDEIRKNIINRYKDDYKFYGKWIKSSDPVFKKDS